MTFVLQKTGRDELVFQLFIIIFFQSKMAECWHFTYNTIVCINFLEEMGDKFSKCGNKFHNGLSCVLGIWHVGVLFLHCFSNKSSNFVLTD